MSSLSVTTVTTIKYPCFEDVTQIGSSSEARCSSDDLRTMYDLMDNIRVEDEENTIIEKFKENKSLSSRHFKIFAYNGDNKPIIMTFCHMACKKNAKKILDWFISEFSGLSIFENDSSYRLDPPLNYVIENLPDNESNSRIVSKLAKGGYYNIRKECVLSSDNMPPLSREQLDALKSQPNIFLTDRIFRNGKEESRKVTSNVFFRSLIHGKHLMYETILGAYVEKEEVTKIITDCSSMSRDLVSIIYDYALVFITPKVQDALSLTIAHSEATVDENNRYNHQHYFYNAFNVVILYLHMSNDLDRRIQLIKTAKFLLNYHENLAEIPFIEQRFNLYDNGSPFTSLNRAFPYIPNLTNRIKNGDENILARQLMNFDDNTNPLSNQYQKIYTYLINGKQPSPTGGRSRPA